MSRQLPIKPGHSSESRIAGKSTGYGILAFMIENIVNQQAQLHSHC
jgi:hypothetical protein